MRKQITSLPSLSCFRAAAEFESFSKAADSLNLSHGAISRAVRLLETDLETALFTRRNRAVFLTEEGHKLAQAVNHGLGHIEDAIDDIKTAQNPETLTVSCEPTLLMRWLIPRIGELQEQYPKADIRLVAGGGPVALGDGIDVAIRRNDFDVPRKYDAQPLFEEYVGPVCRPDLVDRFFAKGRIQTSAPLLHSRTRPDAWAQWGSLTGTQLGQQPTASFEHFYFSLQGAVAGLGVAMGPWFLVKDDVTAGLLAAPVGFVKDGSQYVLLRPKARAETPVERAFKEWLQTLCAASSQSALP